MTKSLNIYISKANNASLTLEGQLLITLTSQDDNSDKYKFEPQLLKVLIL